MVHSDPAQGVAPATASAAAADAATAAAPGTGTAAAADVASDSATATAPGAARAVGARERRIAGAARRLIRPALDRLPARGPGLLAIRALVGAPALVDGGPRDLTVVHGAATPGRSPGECVLPASDPGSAGSAVGGIVLLLHGGGYLAGSARAYRPAARLVAVAGECAVLAPNYRRAPRHRRPAALQDVLATYTGLLRRGVPADRIGVLGDSAGAHLACELLVATAAAGIPAPGRLALFSPLLTPDSPDAVARDRARPDPVVGPAFARRCVAAAGPGGTQPTDAITGLAGLDRAALPEIRSWVGSTECYAGDAERLHALLDDRGVPNRCTVLPGQVHSFVSLTPLLPAAADAATLAGRFLGGRA